MKRLGLSSEPKITAKDICVLTRQISTMLLAGVPLIQAIDMIGTGSEKKSMQRLITKIADEVKAGNPFSDALRKYPILFDDLYCFLMLWLHLKYVCAKSKHGNLVSF